MRAQKSSKVKDEQLKHFVWSSSYRVGNFVFYLHFLSGNGTPLFFAYSAETIFSECYMREEKSFVPIRNLKVLAEIFSEAEVGLSVSKAQKVI